MIKDVACFPFLTSGLREAGFSSGTMSKTKGQRRLDESYESSVPFVPLWIDPATQQSSFHVGWITSSSVIVLNSSVLPSVTHSRIPFRLSMHSSTHQSMTQSSIGPFIRSPPPPWTHRYGTNTCIPLSINLPIIHPSIHQYVNPISNRLLIHLFAAFASFWKKKKNQVT